jgi:hypothetical protein
LKISAGRFCTRFGKSPLLAFGYISRYARRLIFGEFALFDFAFRARSALILPVTTFIWLSQKSSNANQISVNFRSEKTAIYNEKVEPQENLSPREISKNSNPTKRKLFRFGENLQSGFAENFSALSPFLVGLWFWECSFRRSLVSAESGSFTFIKRAARLRRATIGRRDSTRSANV